MALINHGTQFFIQDGGDRVKVGRLRAVGEMKVERDMVDVTTLDAPGGARMYTPGLKSASDLILDGFPDKEEQGQQKLKEIFRTGEAAQFIIEYPDGDSTAFSAYVKSLSLGGGEVDAVGRFSCTLKITGEVDMA